MKENLSHITIVTDRSGSMQSVRSDAEGAVNRFIEDQKKVDGDCSLYFVDFDTEAPQHVVYDGDLKGAPTYKLVPRGSTPLLDACGQAIVRTGEKLAALPEGERPSKVIFVIQTDGQENASHEYSWDRLSEMIKTQHETYQWEFVFLGMGLDTFKQGQHLGIVGTTQSAHTAAAYVSTYDNTSRSVAGLRGGTLDSHQFAAANAVTVDAAGRVFNEQGEEINPKTGQVVSSA